MSAHDDTAAVERAVVILAQAAHIAVLTGAGISAESGIPTFREAQTGLWANDAPEDLATMAGFERDPEYVWRWYHWRRSLIARGGVNAGHRAISALADDRDVFVATQNVDGLHTAAGSRDVAELHGNIWRDRCPACGRMHTRAVAEPENDAPPHCADCGAICRPDVVWFGESLPATAFDAARRALERADAVLVVGTSNQVYPAAALVDAAVASSTPVIEINPASTGVSDAVDCRIATTASHALPALIAALDDIRASR